MDGSEKKVSVDMGEFDRICRLGPPSVDAWYIYMHAVLHDACRAKFIIANDFGSGKAISKSRAKKAVEALVDAGVFMLFGPGPMSGYEVCWGPSAEEMNEFTDLIYSGKSAAAARKILVAKGVPDPGADFWSNRAKSMKVSKRELAALNAECTGADGEIYGHR